MISPKMIEDRPKGYRLAIKFYFFCFQLILDKQNHGRLLLF